MRRLLLVLVVLAAFGCSKESYPPPAATPSPVAACDPCTAQCPDWKSIGVGPNGVVYQNSKTGEQKTCAANK